MATAIAQSWLKKSAKTKHMTTTTAPRIQYSLFIDAYALRLQSSSISQSMGDETRHTARRASFLCLCGPRPSGSQSPTTQASGGGQAPPPPPSGAVTSHIGPRHRAAAGRPAQDGRPQLGQRTAAGGGSGCEGARQPKASGQWSSGYMGLLWPAWDRASSASRRVCWRIRRRVPLCEPVRASCTESITGMATGRQPMSEMITRASQHKLAV